MQPDRHAAPSYPYIPPQAPEPYRRSRFAGELLLWGLLLGACGLAIWAALTMIESLMSP